MKPAHRCPRYRPRVIQHSTAIQYDRRTANAGSGAGQESTWRWRSQEQKAVGQSTQGIQDRDRLSWSLVTSSSDLWTMWPAARSTA